MTMTIIIECSSDTMSCDMAGYFALGICWYFYQQETLPDMSNTLTNSVIALYCILLYCLVPKCIVLLIYCYVDIIQYNAN